MSMRTRTTLPLTEEAVIVWVRVRVRVRVRVLLTCCSCARIYIHATCKRHVEKGLTVFIVVRRDEFFAAQRSATRHMLWTSLSVCLSVRHSRDSRLNLKVINFFWGKKCIRVTWLEDFLTSKVEMTWLLYCAGAATADCDLHLESRAGKKTRFFRKSF